MKFKDYVLLNDAINQIAKMLSVKLPYSNASEFIDYINTEGIVELK